MKKNKYHIRAVRHELEDDYLCHRQWNKFRIRVEQLSVNDLGLLRAVVLPGTGHGASKSYKGGGGRGRGGGDATLLHTVLQLYSSRSASSSVGTSTNKEDKKEDAVCHIVRILANSVPQALVTASKDYGESPLHVAIDRSCPPSMVQILCEAIQRNPRTSASESDSRHHPPNPLIMKDRNGHTPLHLAAQRNKGYTQILLSLMHSPPSRTDGIDAVLPALAMCQRKGKIPLWYAAVQETRMTVKRDDYTLSDEVQALLLITARQIVSTHDNDPPHEDTDHRRRRQYLQSRTPSSDGAIFSETSPFDVMRALVTCAPWLDKYAVKLMDICLANRRHVCAGMLMAPKHSPPSSSSSGKGDSLLHVLCRQREINISSSCIYDNNNKKEEAVARASTFRTTNALLFEQVWKFHLHDKEHDGSLLSQILQMEDQRGNLPLHLAVQKDYMTTLLRAYPAALQHLNDRGELPLHVALKQRQNERSFNNNAAYIQALWQADPSTLAITDGVTGLYPHLLAAVCHTEATTENDVTISYQLLSAAPEVLGRLRSLD